MLDCALLEAYTSQCELRLFVLFHGIVWFSYSDNDIQTYLSTIVNFGFILSLQWNARHHEYQREEVAR